MEDGNLTREARLKLELRRIRAEARLTQRGLSDLSEVGQTTIKGAERGDLIPKAETLRLLANGAATDGAGDFDEKKAENYYRRLMIASGYWSETGSTEQTDQPPPPPDPLADHLKAAFGSNADQIEDFLIQAKDFSHDDKEWLLQTANWMLRRLRAVHAVEQSEDWHPAREQPSDRQHALSRSN